MSLLRTAIHSIAKSVGSTDLKSKFYRFTTRNVPVGGPNADKVRVKTKPLNLNDSINREDHSKSAAERHQVVKKLPESRSTVSPTKRQQVEESVVLTNTMTEMYKLLSRSINHYFVHGPHEEQREMAVKEEDRKRAAESQQALEKELPDRLASTESHSTEPMLHQASPRTMFNYLTQHINSYFGTKTSAQAGHRKSIVAGQQGLRKPLPKSPSRLAKNPSTVELFHPTIPPANVDEMHGFLSSHINEYFDEAGNKSRRRKVDSALLRPEDRLPVISPVSASKPAKSYTSFTFPKFQTIVDSFVAPKFEDKNKGLADETGFSLSLGKEKTLLRIIAEDSIGTKTRALLKPLRKESDVKLLTKRVEELGVYLLDFPQARGAFIKEGLLPILLRLRQTTDDSLQGSARKALAVIGYTDPVKGRGIRVLALDGGGTRGLLALQTLQKLQDLTGKPIHQLFDYICGVSTGVAGQFYSSKVNMSVDLGATLAVLVGMFQIPLDECSEMYRKLGTSVFSQNVIVGTVKMGWDHSFYDSEIWENLLREFVGEERMIDSMRNPDCPRVAVVSTVVNRGALKAFVFRNYGLKPGVTSRHIGSCQHKIWQAIRASSAAPGFFQEFALGSNLHQDGGLLINNPTALAVYECKRLWPDTPLQCVVSLGTGRYDGGSMTASASSTSLKTKITHVINSATDTEEVHLILDTLLPPNVYFRFNPYLSEDVPLDENRDEKLSLLLREGERYLELNEAKVKKAVGALGLKKHAHQRWSEYAKLKADMYEVFPFKSKL